MERAQSGVGGEYRTLLFLIIGQADRWGRSLPRFILVPIALSVEQGTPSPLAAWQPLGHAEHGRITLGKDEHSEHAPLRAVWHVLRKV